VFSGTVTTLLIHRIAGRLTRRSAPWDCGFPQNLPQTQYTASSFSQPLRRVYGTTLFAATDTIDMPEPGDNRPASFKLRLRDHIWTWLYQRPASGIALVSLRLNALQSLTIRSYLMLMFSALILLLIIAAVGF